MWRTFVCSAFLLIAFAVPLAILRADEPREPVPTKPEGPGNSPASTFSGAITNEAVPQGLTKVGSGTLVLTGSNTYTGGTTLSAGPQNPGAWGADAAPAANRYTGGTTVNAGVLTLNGGACNWSEAGGGEVYCLTGPCGSAASVTAPRSPITQIPKGPVFYIITEGAGLGDSVRAVPCTGKETVLSAVGAAGGISQVSSAKIWIARPSPNNAEKSAILTVDWEAISKRGINATNHTLMPGDRLVFGEDLLTTQSNLLGKKTAPIERMDGIVSLTTSTLRGVQNTPGAAKLIKDLVEKNLITDDEQLKKFILDAIRDQEGKKAGAKTAERTKPSEVTVRSNTATLELKVEQGAEKPKAAEETKEYTITIHGTLVENGRSSSTPVASAPHELAMRPLPAYRIEPPDVIQIEMLKLVPPPPYRAGIFDVLQIRADAPADKPIDNYYMVEADGTVSLGPGYGSVKVAGMTLGEVRAALDKSLAKVLAKPAAYVQLARLSGSQPVTGQYLVGPDGTVNLRKYGQVCVSGMTVAEAKAAIEKQLAKFLQSPDVSVGVIAYNSKVYYVITQGAGLGDSVRRLPVTGNETVLDAISQINGLSQVSSSKDIRIVRPSASDPRKATILQVDWAAISRRGETATNYQIFPRDRIYIGEDALLTSTNLIAKKTAPIERAMGIISLTTSTVQSIGATPGGAAAVKELVRKGVFDNDPELKRIVEATIRASEEASKKADAKPPAASKPGQ